MFAVIQTGGKQFRVAQDEVLKVGRLAARPGEIVTFPVLMLGGDKPVIGSPAVAGATVAAEVVEEGRGRTVIAFKKRRRQNSKRKRGYRDTFTLVRITEILTDGKQPSLTAKTRAEKKPKAEAKPAETEAEEVAEKPKAKTKSKAKAPARAKAPAKKKAPAKTTGKGKKK
jgi:large subunit ribosomal protein L21